MEFSKYRFSGRAVGFSDAIVMKHFSLTPNLYYSLCEKERLNLFSMAMIPHINLYNELNRLAEGCLYPTSSTDAEEYKIGLREGMLFVRNEEFLMNLTKPTNYWR